MAHKADVQQLIAEKRRRARDLERIANQLSNPEHRQTLLEQAKALDEEAEWLEAEAGRIF